MQGQSGSTVDGYLIWHAGNDAHIASLFSNSGSTLQLLHRDGTVLDSIDLAVISHPDITPASGAGVDSALTGSNVISQVAVDTDGHVTSVATRSLASTDLSDAATINADTVDSLHAADFLRSNSEDAYTPKRLILGSSSNWDNGSLDPSNTTITNLHFQGHQDFFVGAGNSDWYTTPTTKHHDLLINTMMSDDSGGYTRGITFTASREGYETTYKLGRWVAADASVANSVFYVYSKMDVAGDLTGNTLIADTKVRVYNVGNGDTILEAGDGAFGTSILNISRQTGNDITFDTYSGGSFSFLKNIDITGNITVSGTVDGKDIANYAAMINEDENITAQWNIYNYLGFYQSDQEYLIRSYNASASNAAQFYIKHDYAGMEIGNLRGDIDFDTGTLKYAGNEVATQSWVSGTFAGSSNIVTVGTLSSGAVPASLVTAGNFGAGNYVINGGVNSGRYLDIQNTTNDTGAHARLGLESNEGLAYVLHHATSRTTTRHGVAVGGYMEIYAPNSSQGIMIGTGTADKVIKFGVNNTIIANIDNAGMDITGTLDATDVKKNGSTVLTAADLSDYALKSDHVSDTELAAWGGSANIVTVGTLAAGAIPASLITAGQFGVGDYTIQATSGSTASLYISGTGNGHVNAAIVFKINDDDTTRGAGIYAWSDANDIEWFSGRGYSGSADKYVINRRTGATSHNKMTADSGEATVTNLFSLDNAGNLVIPGTFSASGYNNSNWDTAHGWGDHALAGYQSATTFTTNGFLQNRATSTPDTVGDSAGITLNYLASGATNKPTGTDHSLITMSYSADWQTQIAADWRNSGRLYIRGQNNGTWSSWYQQWSEDDFTSTQISNWDTAYGWGDHASAGYALQSDHVSDTELAAWAGSTNLTIIGSLTQELDVNSQKVSGVKSIIFNNTEGDDHGTIAGTVAFDENFYGDTEYGDAWAGGNGGGLAVYGEDGWNRLISDKNMGWLDADFYSLDIGGTAIISNTGVITNATWNGVALTAAYVPAHDSLTGFVANEHINWTNSSSDFKISKVTPKMELINVSSSSYGVGYFGTTNKYIIGYGSTHASANIFAFKNLDNAGFQWHNSSGEIATLDNSGNLSVDGSVSATNLVVLNDRSDGYVWIRRSSTSPALYVTQQSTGDIQRWYQGANDGTEVASIENSGRGVFTGLTSNGTTTLDGDVSIGNSAVGDNHWLTFLGADGSSERTGLSMGESGKWGSAALHIYYTGDGYGHLGMGVMAADSHAAYRALYWHYQSPDTNFVGNAKIASGKYLSTEEIRVESSNSTERFTLTYNETDDTLDIGWSSS